MVDNRIYAVRNKKTGKLLNNMSARKRRFYEVKGQLKHILSEYIRIEKYYRNSNIDENDFEIVTFELVEKEVEKYGS